MHRIGKNSRGFTLIEVLIAMAVGLVILGALYQFFVVQKRAYDVQAQVAEMEQNARAAMDMMVREIRMAGYDPPGYNNANIVTAQSNLIRFTEDITCTSCADKSDGDGDVLDANEDITYAVYIVDGISKLGRKSAASSTNYQPVADNIESVTFSYFDANGLATATLANIREIRIALTARTSLPDPTYTHPIKGDRYRRVTLNASVIPRNLAF